MISLDSPVLWVRSELAQGRRPGRSRTNCIYGTSGNVFHHTSGFILKTLYFTPQSGTNQNAWENVAISEISEAAQILSPVQKQDHLDNQISKYVPSIRYRLRDPPSAVKYLARPPGQAWYHGKHSDIRQWSCQQDRCSSW